MHDVDPGGTVVLDHGHGVSSTFIHMSRVDVQVGDRLQQGGAIGHVLRRPPGDGQLAADFRAGRIDKAEAIKRLNALGIE